jgi:butyrate kinase
MYKVVAINLGSTSTKLAYYEDDNRVIKVNIEHPAEEIRKYPEIMDQYQYRFDVIGKFLEDHNINYRELDAIVSRGGHTHPIVGGTYKINEDLLGEVKSGKFGRHAGDLGVLIAYSMAGEGKAIPMVVDPPTTDEFEPMARYSGLPDMPRRSSFHALNHRAVGRQYAKDINRPYEDLNLIVVHMGGGITVAVHSNGKMIDANNGLEGDGPFSTNRTGTLPVGALVDACYSGKYTYREMKRRLNGRGGMMAYIGENDVQTVQKKALEGNVQYKECLDAMLYQTCKEVGSLAPVVKGRVGPILLTGGVAYSEYVTKYIDEHVNYLAKVVSYPGEYEMQALALGAYDALRGTRELKLMKSAE